MSSDITHLVHGGTSQLAVAGPLSGAVESEESVDMMEQDEESLDSEEDGLRQLLLLQQTKYQQIFLLLSISQNCHFFGS